VRTEALRALIVVSVLATACGQMHNTCPAPGPGCTPAADVAAELARILAIEDGRAFDTDRLAALARHEAPVVRRWAVRAVGRLRDPRGIPIVHAALEDPDPEVRAEAAFAAGLLRDTTATELIDRLAARGLLEALAEDDVARIAVAARVRLGRIRPEEAVVGDVALPLQAPPRDDAFYAAVVRRLVLPDLAGGRKPRVRVHTTAGSFVIELAPADAPLTVHNFLELARRGYFDGLRWHRVVPNFVIQGGDPTGTGSGGPGYAIRDEVNRIRFARGVVGMALSGPDTGGSQFFVTHSPQPHLDGDFTIFGRVVEGIDVVDRTVQDDWIEKIEIL
jgi:cyclophilin family peptidyl-prolyl cis-trans isomerase